MPRLIRAVVAAAILSASVPARAAEITVLAPGIVVAPIRALAARWEAATGNKAIVNGGNVASVSAAVAGGSAADVVVLPGTNLDELAPRLMPGSRRPIGRVVFGLVVRRGGRHPDISTPEKFAQVVRGAGVLAFSDPSKGSLSGRLVEQMLRRPEFDGVKPLPSRGMVGQAVVRGDAEFGEGAVSEALMTEDAEIVGRVPDSLDLHIDMDGAVVANAPAAREAGAFLRYMTSRRAQAVWAAGGIDSPRTGRHR